MRLIKAIERKREVLRELGPSERAKEDYHAKREPRDCGLTVHPGIGCDLGCVYCYIKDMGFPTDKVEPYPLSGRELAIAIASNPNVGIGPTGSYLAVGSITEPFHPLLLSKTIEYLKWLKYLGNYTQISYKMIVPESKVDLLTSASEDRLSVLVSITTIERWRDFEPKVPSPEQRLQFAEKLLKRGKRVALFVRPLLPGVIEKEMGKLLETSLSYGVNEVVVGGLRVTERIYEELLKRGVELEGRLRERPRGRRQVYVNTRDLKIALIREASKRDMKVYFTACDANARHHGEVCWDSCKYDRELCDLLPAIDERDLREGLEMIGVKLLGWKVRREPLLEVEVSPLKREAGWLLQMAYRRQVILRSGKRRLLFV
ncbi:radical SAM protein [Ignicoccus islandicus]|nr:radical SAM protein [Ignicoccus islandicus]